MLPLILSGFGSILIAVLFQLAYLPFTAALGLLLTLVLLQLAGLHGDLPGGSDHGLGAALDWLNVGRLPVLVLLIVVLAAFAIVGFCIQFAAAALTGLLPWPLASIGAAAAAIPITRLVSRPLARILPMDETTAVDIDTLVGRRARIVLGTARIGHAARAEVIDAHGYRHFVMVEPSGDAEFTDAQLLLLVGRDGPAFKAVAIPEDVFSELRL